MMHAVKSEYDRQQEQEYTEQKFRGDIRIPSDERYCQRQSIGLRKKGLPLDLTLDWYLAEFPKKVALSTRIGI